MKEIEIHCCAAEKSTMSFPMGALCIKTAINHRGFLPKAKLFEHFLDNDPVLAAKEAARRKPWALGIATYIWNAEWFESFAKNLRKLSPETILFAGGPQAIAYTKGLPKWLDFAVLGEAEVSTVEVLKELQDGTALKDLKTEGLITESFLSPVNSKLPNLEELQSPFLSGEADYLMGRYDSVLWEMTRGCPFACAFCFESRGKRIVRDYPMKRIEKELDYLIKHGTKNVFVLDPTFNLNPDRAKSILRMLVKKAPYDMHFTFEIRAELLDEELADLFAQLNCSLQIGLQSSDQDVLKKIGRHFDIELFSNKVMLLVNRGVPFGLDVIIGLPEDTIEKFKRTIDFCVSLKPSNIDCFLLSLLPGTELAERAGELGLVSHDNVERTILRTPSFDEKDIEIALKIKAGMDLFFTKGQSCMWLHSVLGAIGISASDLFIRFVDWLSENDKDADEEDIWILQDDFITDLFVSSGKRKLLDAIKSYMELHQGICFVTDTCETAQIDLHYSLEDLSNLDRLSLEEFTATYKKKNCHYDVVMEEDGIRFY